MRLPVLALVLVGAIPAQDEEPPTLADLVKDLASDRPQTWQVAEFNLVHAGSEAVPLLIPNLRGDRGELRTLRVRVIKVLGRMGADAKAAGPSLEKLLSNADKPLAILAARSLVQIDPKNTSGIALLMKSGDPVSKMVLCGALRKGEAPVVPLLLVLIRDPHKGVRAAAGRALAGLAADPSVEIAGPTLFSMLDLDNHVVRIAAMGALADMGNPPRPTAGKVRSLLTNAKAEERVAAIQCLCDLKPRPDWLQDVLIGKLEDPKPQVRRAARVGLLLHSPDTVKRMFGAKDWKRRRSAAEVLRWADVEDESSPAILLLVRLLQDPQPGVRGAAATSLGKLAPHSRAALSELKLALRDPHGGVRSAAVKALTDFRRAHIEVPEAEMARMVDDKDSLVRAAAIEVLPTSALDAPMVDKLIELLADDSTHVRITAFRKLRLRVRSRAVLIEKAQRKRAFAAALVMPDRNLRRQARTALRLKNYEPDGEEFLLEFLEHKDSKVRVEAITALEEMKKAAKKHLPRLRKLLEDPEPGVRTAAESAIAEIQGAPKKGPGTERLKLR